MFIFHLCKSTHRKSPNQLPGFFKANIQIKLYPFIQQWRQTEPSPAKHQPEEQYSFHSLDFWEAEGSEHFIWWSVSLWGTLRFLSLSPFLSLSCFQVGCLMKDLIFFFYCLSFSSPFPIFIIRFHWSEANRLRLSFRVLSVIQLQLFTLGWNWVIWGEIVLFGSFLLFLLSWIFFYLLFIMLLLISKSFHC